MHIVGFIIRIYHDARSSECQIRLTTHVIVAGADDLWSLESQILLSSAINCVVSTRIVLVEIFNP